jgi:hypothetical protein
MMELLRRESLFLKRFRLLRRHQHMGIFARTVAVFYAAPLGLCRTLCRVPSTDVLGSIIASLRDWKTDRP